MDRDGESYGEEDHETSRASRHEEAHRSEKKKEWLCVGGQLRRSLRGRHVSACLQPDIVLLDTGIILPPPIGTLR